MSSSRKPDEFPDDFLKRELARMNEGIDRLARERLVNAQDAQKRHEEVLAGERSMEEQLTYVFENVQELVDNALGTHTQASPDATTPAPRGKRGRKGGQAHIALFINQLKNGGKTWPEILRLHNDVFKRQANTWQRMRDIWRRYYGDKKPVLHPGAAHPEMQKNSEKPAKVGRHK